jgi:N-carbamoylputrescine amidase
MHPLKYVERKIMFSMDDHVGPDDTIRNLSASSSIITGAHTQKTMSSSTLPPYSYSPQGLLESYLKLKTKEDESLKQATESSIPAIQPSAQKGDSFVVAAVQLTAGGLESNSLDGFFERAQQAVRQAAEEKGANLILLPELFIGPYFCQSQEACLMGLACEADNCFIVQRMQRLAKQYQVVLPISIFERKHNALYNSIIMIDADGSLLGTYRKSHIPDGTGYQEKFYFSPGDTGFKVWKTKVGNVGVAICWDQWFPEAARAMALQGADILLYPTAIGTEPQDPTIDSADHWQRTMQGHAAANVSIIGGNGREEQGVRSRA